MAARKQAEEKAEDAQADERAQAVQVEEVAPADEAEAQAKADENYVVTEDAAGRPVAESYVGEKFSTIDHDEDDPSVELPTPGGPGDEGVASRSEKAFVLAAVTHPEVTSENPEPYTQEELNHRFTHIPPAGFVERKFPVKQ